MRSASCFCGGIARRRVTVATQLHQEQPQQPWDKESEHDHKSGGWESKINQRSRSDIARPCPASGGNENECYCHCSCSCKEEDANVHVTLWFHGLSFRTYWEMMTNPGWYSDTRTTRCALKEKEVMNNDDCDADNEFHWWSIEWKPTSDNCIEPVFGAYLGRPERNKCRYLEILDSVKATSITKKLIRMNDESFDERQGKLCQKSQFSKGGGGRRETKIDHRQLGSGREKKHT